MRAGLALRRRPRPGGALTSAGAAQADGPPRCVHYVGFRDDRYWNAYRLFGGPRVIHRRWDWFALHDVGPGDTVVFAEGDETQPLAKWNAADIDERWLLPSPLPDPQPAP